MNPRRETVVRFRQNTRLSRHAILAALAHIAELSDTNFAMYFANDIKDIDTRFAITSVVIQSGISPKDRAILFPVINADPIRRLTRLFPMCFRQNGPNRPKVVPKERTKLS